jgi:hypothetical protein
LSADPASSKSANGRPTSVDDAAAAAAGGRRRLVEIRCGFAEMARTEAQAAAARAVDAQRQYDEQAEIVARAQTEVDRAGAHAPKDEAHRAFRAAVASARTRTQVEAAATAWLDEINKINIAGRGSQARVRLERDVADALRSELTRLSDMAEASAAMADSAMAACRAAQAALAAEAGTEAAEAPPVKTTTKGAAKAAAAASASEKPEVASAAPAAPFAPPAATPGSGMQFAPLPEEPPPSTDWLVIDLRSPEPQVIVQLMRRDGRTMNALVARLAGTDPTTRSGWGLLLSTFVDAVVAAAIDEACLDFPSDNPFWGQFTPAEAREVARGLAALGFHYDSFEGFSDGRVPTQRDLSMAVGNAGLLPARVKHWPKVAETEDLFIGVRVSGDTFIAGHAPALTLGELVQLLGRRAEPLSDLWNDWPRLRPLLFATSL